MGCPDNFTHYKLSLSINIDKNYMIKRKWASLTQRLKNWVINVHWVLFECLSTYFPYFLLSNEAFSHQTKTHESIRRHLHLVAFKLPISVPVLCFGGLVVGFSFSALLLVFSIIYFGKHTEHFVLNDGFLCSI